MEAKEALWQTADRTELVRDGDPRASFLFASRGTLISDADAARYGIEDGRLPETKQVEPEDIEDGRLPETKQVEPEDNKQRSPRGNK